MVQLVLPGRCTMTMKITLSLDETVYERARLLAEQQRQDVAKALVRWLDETLPPVESAGASGGGQDAEDAENAAVEREMQAYIALHPQLVRQYKHQYVAVYDGRLVDHDADYESLFMRIEDAYPDSFVWLTQVEEHPIDELVFRSPHLNKSSR
jgi:hypothetical protein